MAFNDHIDRCAFPVGWGANAAFGHAGPGEINKRVIEIQDDFFIVQYETGARKEIRFHPHNVRLFDMPVWDRSDLESLQLPDPDDPGRYAGFAEDVAWAKAQGEWTVGWVNGFFSGVHYFLRDYAEFLADLASDREFAGALIEKLGNWTLSAARHLCEAGVDCIGFCDDLGSGTFFSPTTYRGRPAVARRFVNWCTATGPLFTCTATARYADLPTSRLPEISSTPWTPMMLPIIGFGRLAEVVLCGECTSTFSTGRKTIKWRIFDSASSGRRCPHI